jgi:hypothetical protein
MISFGTLTQQYVTWETIVFIPFISITCSIIGVLITWVIGGLSKFRANPTLRPIFKLVALFVIASFLISLRFLIPFWYKVCDPNYNFYKE